MPVEQVVERHTLLHREEVVETLQKLKLPLEKCLLVGSGAIAQQYTLLRTQNDIDLFVPDLQVWEMAKKMGIEREGPLGNSVIQIKSGKWDIEVFRYLPGMPTHRTASVFKRAQFQHGLLTMSLIDLAIWKWHLRKLPTRSENKKRQDWKDIQRSLRGVLSGFVYTAIRPTSQLNAIKILNAQF